MRSIHRRLLLAGRSATGMLLTAILLGVGTALLAVAQAWLLAITISDTFFDAAVPADLAPALVALALVFAGRALAAWMAEIAAQRISAAVKADLRVSLVARAIELGPRWAAGRATAETTLLITRGLDALDGYYGRYLPQLALAVIVPLVVVACLFTADLVAALTVMLTVPLIPVFMVLIGRMSATHRQRRWTALSRLANRFADVVAGLPTLRAYGRAEAQVEILRRITDRYRSTTMATLRIAFLSALVLELLATLSVALVAVGIGLRLADGDMSLQTGLFVLVLAPEAYLPLRRLGAEFHASEEGLEAAARAFAILDTPAPGDVGGRLAGSGAPGGHVAAPDRPAAAAVASPSSVERGIEAGAIAGIVVENVGVEQPGRGILAPAGVSFEARAGEVVAVTGASGAGKSTLLSVIMGTIPATEGEVSVIVSGPQGRSRIALGALDPRAWSARLAWVPQAPWLFAGTVADNVRLGAPDADGPAVAAALAAAALGDVSPTTAVGERGVGLSSGQRRRVGIARALVRRTPVLLLDEPTAGLDAVAEAAVMRTLREVADAGAIVIVVAHRPGAVGGADRAVEIGWRARRDPGEPRVVSGTGQIW